MCNWVRTDFKQTNIKTVPLSIVLTFCCSDRAFIRCIEVSRWDSAMCVVDLILGAWHLVPSKYSQRVDFINLIFEMLNNFYWGRGQIWRKLFDFGGAFCEAEYLFMSHLCQNPPSFASWSRMQIQWCNILCNQVCISYQIWDAHIANSSNLSVFLDIRMAPRRQKFFSFSLMWPFTKLFS